MPPAALRALLAGLIDYAGLFPPAALPLPEVARNYAGYRTSADAWALGRLVLPAARLAELAMLVTAGEQWPVSALLSDDIDGDLARIAACAGSPVRVEVVEGRLSRDEDIARVARLLGPETPLYTEIPVARLDELLPTLAGAGARAKIRTGGVSADAFPAAAEVARFILSCSRASVPFKATAGLHHPVRGSYPLTYDAGAQRTSMYGFLNVFIAAAMARSGAGVSTLERVLMDDDPSHFSFSDADASWCDSRVDLATLQDTRASTAIAFGSCSFREPLDDLASLGLLTS